MDCTCLPIHRFLSFVPPEMHDPSNRVALLCYNRIQSGLAGPHMQMTQSGCSMNPVAISTKDICDSFVRGAVHTYQSTVTHG